jgi:hypothetical protein
MATYILLDPNEIVQQQQAMAAVAANHNPNVQNKSSDVSLYEHHFLLLSFPCVYIHSSYVYLANLHDVLNLFPFRFNPSSSLFICIELNRRVDSHLLTFFFFFFFSALDLRHKGHH